MFYKVKREAVVVSLTFLLGVFALLHIATAAELSHDHSSETDSDPVNRVIIVYPLNGCGSFVSESVSDSSGLELQSSRRARNIALNELEKRVNEFRNEQLSQSGTDLRSLSPGQSSTLFDSNQKTSIKLTTQYLNAVQMEIAQVPSFMTDDEMVQISETLPCVEMVEKDYLKRMQDPIDAEPIDPSSYRHLTEDQERGTSTRHSHGQHSNYGQADYIDKVIDFSVYRNLQASSKRQRDNSNPVSSTEGVNSEGLMVPNDQLFPDQWHLQQTVPWSIQSQRGWAEWRGSNGMVIAIIDSGCDLTHPDLEGKRWVNNGEICDDGIDNDKNGYIDDCYGWDWVDNDNTPSPQGSGHGTAAAGIIAATTDNMIGVAGICWDCRIMCLRFIQGVEGRVSNQVAAIDYAAKMGAKISNNSYGGYGFSRLEFEVINRARSYGHLFVSSAGNNNYNTDLPQYDHTPSIYNLDNILAVGASTKTGRKASFSNYGKVSVDFFAPGSRIVTTENGGGYAVVSGTSFAAPMGVGAAALVWSKFPLLSNTEIIKALTESCRKTREFNGLAVCEGILDVDGAMKAAAEIARVKSGGGTAMVRKETSASTPDNKNSDENGKDSSSDGNSANTLTSTTSTGYTGWLGAFLSGFSRAVSYPSGSSDSEGLDLAKDSTNTMTKGDDHVSSTNSSRNIAVEGIEDSLHQPTGPDHRPEQHRLAGVPTGVHRLITSLLASPTNWVSSTLKNWMVVGGN